MRTSTVALIALSAATVFAGIPGLPACANDCVTSFGSCNNLDVKCICSDSSLIAGLACCVGQKCDAADQQAAITFADSLCAGQGVTNLPQAATCAPGASSLVPSSGASSAASTSGSSSASVTSTPASVSSAIASASSAASSAAASVSSSAAQASTSASSSSGQTTASAVSNTPAAAASSAASASAKASSGAMANHIEGMGLGLVAAGLLAVL